MFGGDRARTAQWYAGRAAALDLGYRRLDTEERDGIIREAVGRLDTDAVLPVAGSARLGDWEAGWSENLSEFVATDYALGALVPKYIQPNKIVRLLGDYARPSNPHFIREYTELYREWLAEQFFTDAAAIYEFGCGPGWHVAYFAQTFPGKPVVGLDWANASQKILALMAARYGWNVAGRRFDFFDPDKEVRMNESSVVLTFGALEQVGERHEAFLQYLLAQRPLRCVHVEGFNELYEPDGLLDFLALRYHRKRNYLWNLLTRLRELELEGRVVIEAVHRQHFGNRFDDPYSTVVWRPAL